MQPSNLFLSSQANLPAVRVRTLCSGSSGNATLVSDGSVAFLVDCGVGTQRMLRQMLAEQAEAGPPVAAVVVSHLHSDHICYSSLRVLEAEGIPVCVHCSDEGALARRHYQGMDFSDLRVRTYGDEPFWIGKFHVQPVPVRHAPRMNTHAFAIAHTSAGRTVRLGLATDLTGGDELEERFADADFLCLEANHDPALLMANPNPNSAYHLENSRAARLLRAILQRSARPPKAVLLAHLSEQRNTPEIALGAMRKLLEECGHGNVRVAAAPRFGPSEEFLLA